MGERGEKGRRRRRVCACVVRHGGFLACFLVVVVVGVGGNKKRLMGSWELEIMTLRRVVFRTIGQEEGSMAVCGGWRWSWAG